MRAAANSLASRQEALYMQLSPEKDSSQSKPRHIQRRWELFRWTPPRKTGIWVVFQIPAPQ